MYCMMTEHHTVGLGPSTGWRVADRETGGAVDRSTEERCLEWIRAQSLDDVENGRFVIVPPAGTVVAECPGCHRRITMSVADWGRGPVACMAPRLDWRNGLQFLAVPDWGPADA